VENKKKKEKKDKKTINPIFCSFKPYYYNLSYEFHKSHTQIIVIYYCRSEFTNNISNFKKNIYLCSSLYYYYYNYNYYYNY